MRKAGRGRLELTKEGGLRIDHGFQEIHLIIRADKGIKFSYSVSFLGVLVDGDRWMQLIIGYTAPEANSIQ